MLSRFWSRTIVEMMTGQDPTTAHSLEESSSLLASLRSSPLLPVTDFVGWPLPQPCKYRPSPLVVLGLGVQILLQLDSQLLAQGLKLLEVLLVLLLVLDLGLNTCVAVMLVGGNMRPGDSGVTAIDACSGMPLGVDGLAGLRHGTQNIPSKIRTAVGKSLTRRAALSAAVHTEGEGTRS